jgi:uncharacterized membrane protein/nitrite reductase/ring-hydroxylating ferredoxin subunit
MKSHASLKSHPLHPILIPFPIAFLVGAFLFDLAGRLFSQPEWWATGGRLAGLGIIAALIAAVPGIVDYRRTVPPRSSGKRRAAQHGMINTGAVILFAAGWLLRDDVAGPPSWLVLVLELGGVVCLAVGGWMGGTLVYRNQIGVDVRYAEAGKWKEVQIDPAAAEPQPLAAADELSTDQMKLVRIGEQRMVLARTADGHALFDDRCPHKGGSLAGGMMVCGTVQCPWHGSQFRAKDGSLVAGPAKQGIATRPVEQRGEKVYLAGKAGSSARA